MNSLLLMKTTLPWYSSLQLLPSYIYDPCYKHCFVLFRCFLSGLWNTFCWHSLLKDWFIWEMFQNMSDTTVEQDEFSWTWSYVLLELIICTSFIVGSILNSIIIIIFIRKRGFRTSRNRQAIIYNMKDGVNDTFLAGWFSTFQSQTFHV